MPRVQGRQRRRELLVLVRHDIIYQAENFPEVIREALPLIQRHWDEVDGRRGFNFDFDLYYNLHRLGALRVFTVRQDGTLVGYATFFVIPDEQRKDILVAVLTAIWLTPSERKGWTGYKLLKYSEKRLHAENVENISFSLRGTFRNEKDRGIEVLLRRLGYVLEVHYRKELRV